ncbi:Six-hairpin glycosidase [Penicillium hispanicum]|uniref:Six-hairpin glycosidase n=1 Tax=Penicillium hispanicum TaxID=1080232 RepID=UPI0025419952|nr:Six-hairpin glycosidase [Penicillium hispanicum]KAJ5595454.1 Six-hairpin glycosidase [Penicillium hispanicum]
MKRTRRSWGKALFLIPMLGPQVARASVDLNLDDTDSIKSAAKTAAAGMLKYYTGYRPGDVPGNLPSPYYWWEAGAMFGAMVEYWAYTQDAEWNDWTTQALLWQVGADDNYMPANQTLSLGNDDQIFWAFAVMSAAELKYPNPPADKPQWLALAENVFNSQIQRWDTSTCGGGIHWQIYPTNKGYSYKNTISNGGLFNVASRLARYTQNQTYADWANKIWDWVEGVGFISDKFDIYDGADSDNNCTLIDKGEFAYLPAIFMHGAANMYNHTKGSTVWKKRLAGIVGALSPFYPNHDGVMAQPCEVGAKCDLNQRSFKAYLSRFMAATIPLAPFTEGTLTSKLNNSAIAAAQQCNGPDNACGQQWTERTKYSGLTGIGEQMSAMEAFKALLVHTQDAPAPVTQSTGGTSQGNSAGGSGSGSGSSDSGNVETRDITTGDRAGAGILTFLGASVSLAVGVFVTELI